MNVKIFESRYSKSRVFENRRTETEQRRQEISKMNNKPTTSTNQEMQRREMNFVCRCKSERNKEMIYCSRARKQL